MPSRPNPLSLEVLGELKWDKLEESFTRLCARIQRDDDARSEWISKVQKIEKQLRGKEERHNKPWEHASDLSIPLTKKLLRRWIPVLYNLVALADPISTFKATNFEGAMVSARVEDWFTWLLRDYMSETLSEVSYLVNDIGAKGMGYLGVSWDYRTELESRIVMVENLFPQGPPQDLQQIVQTLVQQYDIQNPDKELLAAADKIARGAPYVRLSFMRVVADKPRIYRHDPLFVVVPPGSGASHEAEYVAIAHEFTPSELRQRARDGLFNAEAVEKLIADAGTKSGQRGNDPMRRIETTNADSAVRETQQSAGVNVVEDLAPIRVFQVYCFLDYNGDGIDERCVLWFSPTGKNRLSLTPYVFSFRHWPIFRFDYEKVDRRPYLSQGMGEQLKDIQTQYTKQYRATSDAIDVQLAPVFQMRQGSKLAPRSIKWGPGRVIPVTEIGDISPVEKNPFNLHEYLGWRQELKAFGEEMVGSIDAALAATGHQLERRTAFEVQAVSGQIEALQGMDAAVFQQSMAKVFECVWELWLDLGPDVVYYSVTGEQFPRLFRKSEHAYKYQLVPAGTPGNTNRSREAQQWMQLGQAVMQIAPDLTNRAFFVQRLARLIEPRLAQQLVMDPQQSQTQQILQSTAQQIAQGEGPEALRALTASPVSRGGAAQ